MSSSYSERVLDTLQLTEGQIVDLIIIENCVKIKI
jgi:hypothetical protein